MLFFDAFSIFLAIFGLCFFVREAINRRLLEREEQTRADRVTESQFEDADVISFDSAEALFVEEFDVIEENDSDEEYTELFRFFPDGGASGKRELIFRYNSLQRKFLISPLTGKLYIEETEE